MNSSLQTLLVAQTSANQTGAIGLIGKDVQYKSTSVTFDGTNATQVHGNLSAQASIVTATIVDATGKTVRTLTTNGAAPGQLSMSWDGRDSSGNTLPAGSYTVHMVAVDASGNNIPVDSEGTGHVTGISFANGYPQLQIGSTTLTMSDIVSVTESTN